jgi:hypothetical protein
MNIKDNREVDFLTSIGLSVSVLNIMTQESNSIYDSPGNALYPEVPAMRAPCLEFVYRLVAKMHPTDGYDISNVMGTGVSRSIGHIQSGTVKGREIEGIGVENSGADWAEQIHSKKVSFRLPFGTLC